MNEVELKAPEIRNLKDLKRQQHILEAEIQQKELQIQRMFREVKEDWSMGKIIKRSMKYSLNQVKHSVTGNVPTSERGPAAKGLISSALSFGAFKASGFAAKKLSGAILSIFGRKK